MEAGLIFVSTSDTIGCIVRAVIKQPYNYIGFFINSEEKGYYRTKIWIIDLFDSSKPSWLHKNSIDELKSHYLVNSIGIKKLKPIVNNNVTDLELTSQNIENFKIAICNSLNNYKTLDLTTAIYKLFGHDCESCIPDQNNNFCKKEIKQNWCEQSADDLVNSVFKILGVYEDLKFPETIKYSNVWNSIKKDPKAIMFYNYTQRQNKMYSLYSYMNEIQYFEDLEDIQTDHSDSRHNPEQYNIEKTEYIKNIFNQFINLINTQITFCLTLEYCISENSKSSSSEKIITDLNLDIDKLSKILNNLLNDSSRSRRPNVEKEVNSIFENLNKNRKIISNKFSSKFHELKLF